MKKILYSVMVITMLCFCLTGCGNNDGNDNGSAGNDVEDAVDDVGDAVGDVAGGAVDAGEDAVDGVGDALDGDDDSEDNNSNNDGENSGGYKSYDDAYNNFMNMLPSEGGTYEVKNSDKDLVEYTSGKHGYHFELHDTSKKESKLGDFYLDSDDGKIYTVDEDSKKATSYDMSKLGK